MKFQKYTQKRIKGKTEKRRRYNNGKRILIENNNKKKIHKKHPREVF